MDSEFQKHTLNLHRGDFEKISEFYPDLPAAVIIRRVIRRFVEQIERTGDPSINAEVEIKI